MATDSSPARDDTRSRARAAQTADVMRLAARREGSGGRRESGRSADDGRHGAVHSQPWRAHARHDTAGRRGGRRRRHVLDRRDCRRRTGREESRHASAGKTGADGAGKHGERREIRHRGSLPAAGRSVKHWRGSWRKRWRWNQRQRAPPLSDPALLHAHVPPCLAVAGEHEDLVPGGGVKERPLHEVATRVVGVHQRIVQQQQRGPAGLA